jgi:hypothetical protein
VGRMEAMCWCLVSGHCAERDTECGVWIEVAGGGRRRTFSDEWAGRYDHHFVTGISVANANRLSSNCTKMRMDFRMPW